MKSLNNNILFTGGSGYLASGLIQKIKINNTVTHYSGDVRTLHEIDTSPDIICHFASPSDNLEFKDTYKTSTTIIEGTINMVNIAKKYGAKLVFASTMGVYTSRYDNIYTTCKSAMEHYIKSVYNNYIILRIPRVYSKCRKKGLMRQIKEGTIPEKDMSNNIYYITLEDFVKQTIPVLDCTGITHEYEITQNKSIGEIKRWLEK